MSKNQLVGLILEQSEKIQNLESKLHANRMKGVSKQKVPNSKLDKAYVN